MTGSRDRAIQACCDVVVTCTAGADSHWDAEHASCSRLSLDCADVCAATARVLSRSTVDAFALRTVLLACAAVCAACAIECTTAAHTPNDGACRRSAEACRECERACLDLAEQSVEPVSDGTQEVRV